MHISIPP